MPECIIIARAAPATLPIAVHSGVSMTPRAPRCRARRADDLAFRQDRVPVDDGVPQHALIAAIQIAMQRIEVERDDVTQTRAQIQDRWMSNEALSSPRLTAHDERRAFPIAPLNTTPLRSTGPSRQVVQYAMRNQWRGTE